MNCIIPTLCPCPTARNTIPRAAVVFPLPFPVKTTTIPSSGLGVVKPDVFPNIGYKHAACVRECKILASEFRLLSKLITPYTIIKYDISLTRECRKEIDSYLEWRKRLGEPIKPDPPLFRREFGSRQIQQPQLLTRSGIRDFVNRLLRNTGIRPAIPFTESHRDFQSHACTHAFRKFYKVPAYNVLMKLVGPYQNL